MALNNILEPNNYDLFGNSLTFTKNAVNPGDAETLWVNSSDNNELYFGDVPVSGNAGTVTSITAGTGLSATPVNPIIGAGTISLTNIVGVSGSYTSANITVNGQGQITAAANGSPDGVTSISAGTGITLSPSPIVSTGTVSLTAGGYLDRVVAQGAQVGLVFGSGSSNSVSIDDYQNVYVPSTPPSNFNATTGVYAIPSAGVYEVYFSCYIIPNAVAVVTSVTVIASCFLAGDFPISIVTVPILDNTQFLMTGSIYVNLTSNDTIILKVYGGGDPGAGGSIPAEPYEIGVFKLT